MSHAMGTLLYILGSGILDNPNVLTIFLFLFLASLSAGMACHILEKAVPGEKAEVRKAAEWLKQQRKWLLQMQQLHGIHAASIRQWLDLFVNECNCRGKQEHESLSDVMQHFNDWLKIKNGQRRKNTKKNGMNDTPNEPPDYRKQWMKCLAELCQSVSPEEASQTFSLMRFESFDPKKGVLIVQVPTNEVYERLEGNYVLQLGKFIAKYFSA